jgi:hypothetical protein
MTRKKSKKNPWPYIVSIPGNIRRKLIGSKKFKKQRDK